jgi:hypothetical protein
MLFRLSGRRNKPKVGRKKLKEVTKMAKSKKYPGVYTVQGKKGISYGIDYINPRQVKE